MTSTAQFCSYIEFKNVVRYGGATRPAFYRLRYKHPNSEANLSYTVSSRLMRCGLNKQNTQCIISKQVLEFSVVSGGSFNSAMPTTYHGWIAVLFYSNKAQLWGKSFTITICISSKSQYLMFSQMLCIRKSCTEYCSSKQPKARVDVMLSQTTGIQKILHSRPLPGHSSPRTAHQLAQCC